MNDSTQIQPLQQGAGSSSGRLGIALKRNASRTTIVDEPFDTIDLCSPPPSPTTPSSTTPQKKQDVVAALSLIKIQERGRSNDEPNNEAPYKVS